jgi:hypothetical protein
MVYRLHIPTWKWNKKSSCNCLNWGRGGMRGRDHGDNVNNVKYKPNQNSHYESPQYNEYIWIKKKLELKKSIL